MSSERIQEPLGRAVYPLEEGPDSSRIGTAPSATRTKVAATVQPTSYFATPQRAQQQDIESTIEVVAQSQLARALLRSATSMMCILNEHRQIVAINTAMLDSLDMTHSDDVIGLRPGEAMRCIHEGDHPAGCGTGPFCRACDVAIAIVASQSTGRAVERECMVSMMTRKGEPRDLALLVRASPLELEGERFTILCMTDIRAQKLLRHVEHSFLHSINHLATELCARSSLLRQDHEQAQESLIDVHALTQKLSREIAIERLLISSDPSTYRVDWRQVDVNAVLGFATRLAGSDPSAQLKSLVIESNPQVKEITTDATLLERVLANMLVNAFEATPAGSQVRLRIEPLDSAVRLAVHNAGCMAPSTAVRVFHRHFTTKQGADRGQGTFAIRLLGERLLQGRVGFSTDAQLGTEFFLVLPLRPDRNRRSLTPKPR